MAVIHCLLIWTPQTPWCILPTRTLTPTTIAITKYNIESRCTRSWPQIRQLQRIVVVVVVSKIEFSNSQARHIRKIREKQRERALETKENCPTISSRNESSPSNSSRSSSNSHKFIMRLLLLLTTRDWSIRRRYFCSGSVRCVWIRPLTFSTNLPCLTTSICSSLLTSKVRR